MHMKLLCKAHSYGNTKTNHHIEFIANSQDEAETILVNYIKTESWLGWDRRNVALVTFPLHSYIESLEFKANQYLKESNG